MNVAVNSTSNGEIANTSMPDIARELARRLLDGMPSPATIQAAALALSCLADLHDRQGELYEKAVKLFGKASAQLAEACDR